MSLANCTRACIWWREAGVVRPRSAEYADEAELGTCDGWYDDEEYADGRGVY